MNFSICGVNFILAVTINQNVSYESYDTAKLENMAILCTEMVDFHRPDHTCVLASMLICYENFIRIIVITNVLQCQHSQNLPKLNDN